MRYPISSILCGINGTGKTTMFRQILMKTVTPTDRVLIVTPDPAEWREVDEIAGAEIATFAGIRKIIYYKGCMDMVQRYFNNGVFVMDDARTYIHSQSDDFMIWLQIRRRQAGIDIFAMFHGLTQIPPVFFTFATNLILFYTKDNIKRRADYVDENDFADIQAAKKRIADEVERGNKYYYEIITLDKRFKNGK